MPIEPSILSNQSSASIDFLNGALTPGNREFFLGGGRGNIVQDLARYQADQTEQGTLQFPSDRPRFYFFMHFSKYGRKSLLQVSQDTATMGSIILPLPVNIVDMQTVKYDEQPFGPLGSLLNAQNASDVVRGIQGQISPADAMAGIKKNAPSLVGEAGAKLQSGEVGGDIGRFIGNAGSAFLGMTPNMFMTVLLQGPSYKQPSLRWVLAPRNFQESDTIKEIIRYINNAMAPALTANDSIFTFPLMVRMGFVPNHRWLYRFKPAVIKNFQVNYAPGGQNVFYHTPNGDGTDPNNGYNPPEMVQIDIEFYELEYWLRGDFLEYGGPEDVTADQAARHDDFGSLIKPFLEPFLTTTPPAVPGETDVTGATGG